MFGKILTELMPVWIKKCEMFEKSYMYIYLYKKSNYPTKQKCFLCQPRATLSKLNEN